MSLGKQGRDYFIIGLVQWLLDWGIMAGLSHLGVPVRAANVCGRTSAALLGFWLNGKITFRANGVKLGRVQLARFVLLWVGTTVVGTWAVGAVNDLAGLRMVWLLKPLIEIALAVVAFVISRQWVYRD